MTQTDTPHEDPDIPIDLNSLAEQYQTKKISPISSTLLKTNSSLDQTKPLSSSIDKLLDSFFSKNFSETVETDAPSTDHLNDFNLNETLTLTNEEPITTTDFNLNDILAQRTQSIEINIEPKTAKPSLGGFSLSDLANEYLASTTPGSSTTAELIDNTSSVGNNLIDLIDYEFTNGLSLNSEFDLDTEIKKINFSSEGLLINRVKPDGRLNQLKTDQNQISTSLNLKSNLTCDGVSQARSFDTSECLKKKICRKRLVSHCGKLENFSFIPNEVCGGNCLENVYLVSDESLFGEFLVPTNELIHIANLTNDLFESQFDYSAQMKFLKEKIRCEKRRKITVECVSKYERRLSKTKLRPEVATESADQKERVRKTSGSIGTSPSGHHHHGKHVRGKHHGKVKTKSGSNKENRKAVLMFDFSIPSPDDIVIAKQKFAFKNMRFK